MLSQSSNAKFWAKHGLVVLVAGVSVGLMGYQNMKMTSFERILEDEKNRETELVTTANYTRANKDRDTIQHKEMMTKNAGTTN